MMKCRVPIKILRNIKPDLLHLLSVMKNIKQLD